MQLICFYSLALFVPSLITHHSCASILYLCQLFRVAHASDLPLLFNLNVQIQMQKNANASILTYVCRLNVQIQMQKRNAPTRTCVCGSNLQIQMQKKDMHLICVCRSNVQMQPIKEFTYCTEHSIKPSSDSKLIILKSSRVIHLWS